MRNDLSIYIFFFFLFFDGFCFSLETAATIAVTVAGLKILSQKKVSRKFVQMRSVGSATVVDLLLLQQLSYGSTVLREHSLAFIDGAKAKRSRKMCVQRREMLNSRSCAHQTVSFCSFVCVQLVECQRYGRSAWRVDHPFGLLGCACCS